MHSASKTIFLLISILGFYYFSFKKRQFNFISLSYFSASFYFLPLFFGYTRGKTLASLIPVQNHVYVIGSLVLFSLFASDFIFLKTSYKLSSPTPKYQKNFDSRLALNISSILAFIGFLGVIITTGDAILLLDKSKMLDQLNRFYTLMSFSTILGTTLAFIYKNKFYMVFFFLFILFDIIIGFRTTASISFISITTLWFFNKRKTRFITVAWQCKIQICAILLCIIFFFLYKRIYLVIKMGDFLSAAEILSNSDTYLFAILRSEPFTTQAVLNEIVRTSFTTDWRYLLHNIYQLIPFSNLFIENAKSFNQMFQPSLFPLMPGGMAGNWWAEWLSAFGWLGVFLASLFYSLGSVYLSFLQIKWKNNINLTVLLTVFGVFFAFYIHRNEISYFITLEKRVFLIWFFIIALSSLIKNSLKQYSRHSI